MRFYYPALVYIAVIAASYALPAEAAGANLRAAAPMPVGGCITEDCSNQAQMRMLAKAAEEDGEERMSLSFGLLDDMFAKLKGKTGAVAGAQKNDRYTIAMAKANKANEAKAAALAKANKANEAKAAALAKANKAAGGATAEYQRSARHIAALKKIENKKIEDKKWQKKLAKYTPDLQSVANGYRNNADKLTNSLMTNTDDLVKVLSKNSVFKKAEDQVEAMMVKIAPDMVSKQAKFKVDFKESYDAVAKNVNVGLDKLKKGSKEYEAVMLKQQKDVLGELSAATLKKLKAFAKDVKKAV